jgi:hypothetical protein
MELILVEEGDLRVGHSGEQQHQVQVRFQAALAFAQAAMRLVHPKAPLPVRDESP